MSNRRSRRRFLSSASLAVVGLLTACEPAPPPATERSSDATQDESAIAEKIRNPPSAALEPAESSFPIPNPIFVPPQSLIRRWRVNTVEHDTRVDMTRWRLSIGGLVNRPEGFGYDDLPRLPRHEQTSDLHCVEGWGFYDIRWEGILLSTLLDRAEMSPEATHVNFFTFPNVYSDSLTIEQARLPDTMVAFRANGEPLKEQHGFPLRLVVPSMFGYKSVKWLDRIETARGRHLGYWEQRGWRPDPWIR